MRFVTVAEFGSRFEAELAAQDLAVAEIPYIIRSDDEALFGSGLSSLHGATLLVPGDRLGELGGRIRGDDQAVALAPGIDQGVAHRVQTEQPNRLGPRLAGAVALDCPFRLDLLWAAGWRLGHVNSSVGAGRH